MAAPGAAVGAPVIQTRSLIPLVERVGNQLDLRKQREQARQDRLNKEWTDMLSEQDLNGLDTIQNMTISGQTDAIIGDYQSAVKANNGEPLSHMQQMEFLKRKNQTKAAADRMRAANDNVRLINQEMKDKGYYKDELMMQDVYNKLHVYDEETGQWVGRDDVNPEEVASMMRDSKYIDGDAYFKKDLEDFEKLAIVGQREGPLGSTLITDIETRDVWLRNDDGTLQRGPNGEPKPNMPMLMEELVKDPDKRKVYQDLAEQADMSLGEYLQERVMANTGFSESFRTYIRPQQPRNNRGGAGSQQQTSKNRQAINKLADMFNQHEDVMTNAVESDIPTSTGGLYMDVTDQFPWLLEKGKRPYRVLIDPEMPETLYMIDEQGGEPRAVTRQEFPNLVNRIETFNSNYRGITDIGIEDQFFTREGALGTATGRAIDQPSYDTRREGAVSLSEHRNRLRVKYKDIDREMYGGVGVIGAAATGVLGLSPERFRRLDEEGAARYERMFTEDFGNARIQFANLEAAQDAGFPNTTALTNLTFKVTPGKEPKVTILANGQEVMEDLTPEEWKEILDGANPDLQLIAGQATVPAGGVEEQPRKARFD